MTLSFRIAGASDLQSILSLYDHLHRADVLIEPKVAESALAQISSTPGLDVILGELDGQPVASCYLNVIPNLTRGGRPYAVIENVVTHPDFRRRGIGRALLGHAIQMAWRADCYKVMLMTGNKESIPFYEASGFDAVEKQVLIAKPQM